MIKEITQEKKQVLELLLLADPSQEMVERYLEKGILLVYEERGEKIGEIVLYPVAPGEWEIKNIAVAPKAQKRGIGRLLLQAAQSRCLPGDRLIVGTADISRGAVRFYESCGFRRHHLVKNFFTDNYDHPIYEHGVRLVDMVYLQREL